MRTEGVKEFYLFYMAADNVQIGWNNTQQQQNLALLVVTDVNTVVCNKKIICK